MNGHAHLTDCGLAGIKAIPYGLHMCHFYETREDLAAPSPAGGRAAALSKGRRILAHDAGAVK